MQIPAYESREPRWDLLATHSKTYKHPPNANKILCKIEKCEFNFSLAKTNGNKDKLKYKNEIILTTC